MSDNHYYYGGAPMGGVNSGFGFGNGNGIFDLAALLIVGGIFGGFGWGGGFGGFGGGMGGIAGTTTAAAETAALIGQQNVADRVASINTGVAAVNGIATANGVKIETVKDAVTNGFYANQRDLCQLGNNFAMTAMNNQNATTALLNDMRFANAQCCCDTKNLIQSSFCNLSHQLQSDKCDTLRAIAYEGETTRAMLRDIQTQRLQEELAAAKAQLSQNAQTATIVSAVQAQCAPKCGAVYRSGCGCGSQCGDLLCSVQTAFADEIAQRIINPTTSTAA